MSSFNHRGTARMQLLGALVAIAVGLLVVAPLAAPRANAAALGAVHGSVLGINDTPDSGYDDPLPGVRVAVFDAGTGAFLTGTDTDALGEYRIGSLPTKPLKIRFTKTGWLTTWRPDTVTPVAGSTLELGEIAVYAEAVVSGQVLSSMDPIGGARVTVFDATTGAVLAAKQLGEYEYEYRIGQLPAGQIKVRATKPGYITAWAGPYTLVAGQQLAQSWDPMILYLDMAPATTMTGTVIGQNTATATTGPLAGVQVLLVDTTTGNGVAAVTTDANGAYRFKALAPGPTVTVVFTKDGWLKTRYPQPVELYPYRTPIDLGQTTMTAEAVVSGQVLSSMDPIGGARVTVFDATTGAVLAAKQLGEHEYEYRIGQLPAGQIKVRATKPGYITAWANYPAGTFAQAKTYTLESGQVLEQSWSPNADLYLDLQPKS